MRNGAGPKRGDDLRRRTADFALRIVQLTDALPRTRAADVLGRQLLRCGTSIGANYRAACRARSTAEFISKMGIVAEEADETLYWLELLVRSELLTEERARELSDEADQLLAITIASIRTAKERPR